MGIPRIFILFVLQRSKASF